METLNSQRWVPLPQPIWRGPRTAILPFPPPQDFGFLLQRREWLLLAKFEPQRAGPSEGFLASPFQVLIPSDSSTLLLCSVAVQELFLPCSLPPLPAEPPQAALTTVEASGGR